MHDSHGTGIMKRSRVLGSSPGGWNHVQGLGQSVCKGFDSRTWSGLAGDDWKV